MNKERMTVVLFFKAALWRRLSGIPLLVLSAMLITGCNSKHSDSGDAGTETVSLFQKGKGVLLPDRMRQQFGLEVVEVAEKPMQRQLQKLAQVFRAASGVAPAMATVMLTSAEAKSLQPDQPVRLKATDSEAEIPGKLTRIDQQSQFALGHVEGLLEFADSQKHFPVGAFLTATFTGESKSVLVVPAAALLSAADGMFVYTVNGQHFTRTKIKTGAEADGYVEVEDGLYSGDMVVVKGVGSLWLIELSALKGGTPCCAVPKKA